MFYRIELLSVPRFLFCCSVVYDNYIHHCRKTPNFIELSIIEDGRIISNENGHLRLIEPHSLEITTSDLCCDMTAYPNEIQRHTTVGVLAEYNLTRCNADEMKKHRYESAENVLYLPQIKKLDDKTYNLLLLKLKKISALYHSPRKSNKLSAISAWYDICADISNITLSELDDSEYNHAANLYAERVWNYIAEHLDERINITSMADSLGISEGYMQNTFKNVTGKSIIEYANEYKIKSAAEMLKVHRLKLKDIAPRIGIDDPAYMSRLFKKVMGVSFEEYCKNLSTIEQRL